MLSIFSIPKPFIGHIGIIQRNAVQSWTRLHPACDVILFGDDEGTMEVAGELGARHVPEVDRNEYGTPLLNDTFDAAQRLATHDVLCYVNADIILMSDLLHAVLRVRKRSFLLVGHRWDIDLNDPLDFGDSNWEARLRTYVSATGILHSPAGIDYFVFARGSPIGNLPEFAVGRAGWDNWMIYQARRLGVPVIDATRTVKAIHQNHDFSHHPEGKKGTRYGLEAERNKELAGRQNPVCDLRDATWMMTPHGLRPALTPQYLERRIDRMELLYPHLAWLAPPAREALSLVKRLLT